MSGGPPASTLPPAPQNEPAPPPNPPLPAAATVRNPPPFPPREYECKRGSQQPPLVRPSDGRRVSFVSSLQPPQQQPAIRSLPLRSVMINKNTSGMCCFSHFFLPFIHLFVSSITTTPETTNHLNILREAQEKTPI